MEEKRNKDLLEKAYTRWNETRGGSVDQWVEDCWHKNYQGAPTDGSAWVESECPSHVIRSGSWRKDSNYARTSNRGAYDTNVRYPTHGFRVALSP